MCREVAWAEPAVEVTFVARFSTQDVRIYFTSILIFIYFKKGKPIDTGDRCIYRLS